MILKIGKTIPKTKCSFHALYISKYRKIINNQTQFPFSH